MKAKEIHIQILLTNKAYSDFCDMLFGVNRQILPVTYCKAFTKHSEAFVHIRIID